MSHRITAPPARATLARRALLAHVMAALAVAPGAARAAARDLLAIPALPSAKAAKVLLLGVCLAGRRAVAVGERGVIVFSDDDGTTWRQASVPVSVTLTAVQFPTPEVGWAVGHDGVVLRSQDGGLRWTRRFDGTIANALMAADARQRLETARASGDAAAVEAAETAVEDAAAGGEFGPSRPLLGLWFHTPDDGFVVGSYGQIFRTRDGGERWESLGSALNNPDGLHCNAIAATPTGVLLIAGEGGRVYRSTDDGARWERLDTGSPGALYGVRALPEAGGGETLLAFGFGGRIFRREGVAPWMSVASPTARSLIGGVTQGGAPLLVDAAGGWCFSKDRGASFQPLRAAGSAPVAGVAALREGALLQVGAGGVRVVSLAA